MVFKGAIKESGEGAVSKSTERKHKSRDGKGVKKKTEIFTLICICNYIPHFLMVLIYIAKLLIYAFTRTQNV